LLSVGLFNPRSSVLKYVRLDTSDFRAAAGIAQNDAVVQHAANHAPIRHARPIAESVDTGIARANVELSQRKLLQNG
jgi:hypothetical protein